MNKQTKTKQNTDTVFQGNVLLFYAFDVGEDINLEMIKSHGMVPRHVIPVSSYFKNYHEPVSFYLEQQTAESKADCVIAKIQTFGALTLLYRIPYNSTLEQLKQNIVGMVEQYNRQSEHDARTLFEKIKPAINAPHFYNIANRYYAIQANPFSNTTNPHEFLEKHGNQIASLLRLETKTMGQHQVDDILGSTIGYFGQDLIIIDGQSAFIYDDEYFEPMELFESANVQQLELQYFDKILDKQLNRYYINGPYEIPYTAYIPLFGRKLGIAGQKMTHMRVDIAVVTERLENSIKIVGDSYYSQIYDIITKKFLLQQWRDSIGRKLEIIRDVYQVNQDRLDTLHGEILEMVIIVLISVEIFLALFHK